MRIGIAAWLDALGASGARTRLRGLLTGLAEVLPSNDQVVVLRAPDSEPLPGPFEQVEVAIPPAPTWRRALAERRTLPGLCAEHRLDALDLQAFPVPRRIGAAVCLTIHDLRDLGPFRRRPRWLARRVLHQSLARVNAIVVPSAFVAAELEKACPGQNPPLHVVGAPAPAHGPTTPSAASAFVHVGHLEPRKNLDLLLRAYGRARQLVAGMPRLDLIGRDAGSRHDLEALASSLRLGASVRFLGSCSDAQVHDAIADARAILLPSLYEGFGLPALEGLALGRPVLAANAGALPEVLGSSGTLLPAHDVSAWARALVEVAEQPVGPRLGAVEQSKQFTGSTLARAWHAAWLQALRHSKQ